MPNVKQISMFSPKNIYNGVRYAVKTANMLKGIINSELKRFDKTQAANPDNNAAGGFSLLTAIDEGSGVHDRDGNSILAKYLYVKMDTLINASATATMVRVIIFIDGDNSGVTPTAAELLEVASNTNSPINVDTTARFTIIKDLHFPMSINGDRIMHAQFYKKLDFHIRYRTATGSSGFGKNNIWAYYISNESTNVPSLSIYSRIGFYDN